MAFDAFLKIEGIEGESTDSAHKGEIDIFSFSWGCNQTSTVSGGGGGGAGKASFQDLHFNASASKASPLLFKACATGQHIKQAVLTVRKAGERQQEFIKIELEDVLVSSYLPAGDTGGDRPAEEVALNFAKITYSFTTDGGNVVSAGFDVEANKTT
jgi:type VI secretion system secreted protein Hcp